MDTGKWVPKWCIKWQGFDVGAISDNERYLVLVETVTTQFREYLPGWSANPETQKNKRR